jgi:S-adenosylmethionine hydrolase
MVEWLNSMVFHGGDIFAVAATGIGVGFIVGFEFAKRKLRHDVETS